MQTVKRMCVSCRSVKPKNELIRITTTNNGEVVIDNNKKQTNRAIYVCKDTNCIQRLKKSNAIQRCLHQAYTEDFFDKLIENLK